MNSHCHRHCVFYLIWKSKEDAIKGRTRVSIEKKDNTPFIYVAVEFACSSRVCKVCAHPLLQVIKR